MRRGEFENRLREALDKELTPRGFRLVPQPPADFLDDKPAAVYEADPDEFGPRYPALDSRLTGNTRCVDLWFYLDTPTGRITSDLDGASVESLIEQFGVPALTESPESPEDLDLQLSRLLSQIVAILDAAERR
jgi:hypothetical protein